MKIPLPKVIKVGLSKAHYFPFQIGTQTLEFLQSTIFYVSFADIAVGEFLKIPGAITYIESCFLERSCNKETYEEAWSLLEKYQIVFEKTAFSNVLISLCSHWDWYIRRLSDFIEFSRKHVISPSLAKDEEKEFKRIGNLPFLAQIEILEKACGVTFDISQDIRKQLKEMTLVRNLGLHNRWEIDSKYLQLSETKSCEIGDLRLVEVDELRCWHQGLVALISEISKCVAIKYVDVPDFS